MNEKEYKLNILMSNKESHKSSMLNHEVNISVYTAAIAYIDSYHSDNLELQSFKSQLSDWIVGNEREHSKEAVILSAIEAQIALLQENSND